MSTIELRIQVISDIHLEFYKSFPRYPPNADILVLAGDIGTLGKADLLTQFLEYCSSNWKHVIYVPGNHEFYHSRKTYSVILEELREITKTFSNVHFLVNESVTLNLEGVASETGVVRGRSVDGEVMGDVGVAREEGVIETRPVTFYGTPLFPVVDGRMNDRLKDFSAIKMRDERGWVVPITTDVWNRELAIPQRDWLMSTTLSLRESNSPVILITHYPPVREGTSHPRYDTEPDEMKQYFSNDLPMLTKNLPLNSFVISGHTHYCYDFCLDGCWFVSRAMGYPDEVMDSDFMIRNGVIVMSHSHSPPETEDASVQ